MKKHHDDLQKIITDGFAKLLEKMDECIKETQEIRKEIKGLRDDFKSSADLEE